MPLLTCKENVCDLPTKVNVTVKGSDPVFNRWKSVQGGTLDQFLVTLTERALIKSSTQLQCNVGIEKYDQKDNVVNLQIAHDCGMDDITFTEIFDGMVKVLNNEIEEAKDKITIKFDTNDNPYMTDEHESKIFPVLKDVGTCSVFTSKWDSKDGKSRRTLVPTRQCLDDVQSMLSSIGLALDNEPLMWDVAKEKGEKITVTEGIIGSYLFYHIDNKHPLSINACQELFDKKIIDGSRISYGSPKSKSPDIPEDVKESLDKLYPRNTGLDRMQRIDRYVEDERLYLSKHGGACEVLTKELKDSGEISDNWVWFGNGKNLIVFNPDQTTSILGKWGYDVDVKSWQQDITKQPSVKVKGLSCSLRDYQVDPICRWMDRVDIALKSSTNDPKVVFETVADKIGNNITGVKSYEPEQAIGGIIKAPTGAGKTIIGLVTMATQGMGVPRTGGRK